jgi:hypothetical protein
MLAGNSAPSSGQLAKLAGCTNSDMPEIPTSIFSRFYSIKK